MNIIILAGLFGIAVLVAVILIIKALHNKNNVLPQNIDKLPSMTLTETIKRTISKLTEVFQDKLLTWDRIINWFREHQEKKSDKDNIAFTLMEKLTNGKFKTIQGIFNKRTSEVKDGIVYETEKIDEKLAEVHCSNQLVIYE